MDWLDYISRMDTFSLVSGLTSSILICFVATLSILYALKRQQKARILDQIPGPKTLPLFGNSLDFFNLSPKDVFKQLILFCDQYNFMGTMVRVWMVSTPYVIIYKHVGAEVILRSQKHLDKSSDYSYLHPWLGTGLLTSTGSKWHRRRKMLTPAFHYKILEDFVEVFNQQSSILIEKLTAKADGNAFDVFPYISLCTLDIILESAMGITINVQENSESDYAKAVCKILSLVQLRQSRPWLQPDILFKLLGYESQQKECLEILHGFSNQTIKERRNEFNEMKEIKAGAETDLSHLGRTRKRLAFLDLLLEYSENQHGISDEDIREEVDTFMFEGHDTIAAAFNWCIYLIGLHPEIQERVHQEIDSCLGVGDRPITSADIRELKLLDLCIKEALRLFPSVPFIARELQEDTYIDGYRVPTGTMTIIITYRLHRDSTQFPDPEAFQPERFLPENCAKRNPYAYVPFSAGPRNCIGQKFAQLEEKILLSHFFRKFRVESTVKRENLVILGELILRPQGGNIVKIFPRD